MGNAREWKTFFHIDVFGRGIFILLFPAIVSGICEASTLGSQDQKVPEGWSVQAQHLINMPEGYSSESRKISFCYAFAAANLINHMLNETKGQSPYEPVSAIDLAVYGEAMGMADLAMGDKMEPTPILDDFGNEYRVLTYASIKRKLAIESCAPFQRLKILRSSNPNRSDDFMAFSNLLLPAFKMKKDGKAIDFSSLTQQIVDWEPNLRSSEKQVQQALARNPFSSGEDIQTLLGGIVEPQSCHDNGAILPTFQVALVKIDASNRGQIAGHFIATITRDRPLSWEFCIDDACETQHVLLVTGYRVICAGDGKACKIQFRLRDSGNQVASEPGDYWVDRSSVDSKIDLMFKNYETLNAKSILPNRVVNLEF